MLKYILSILVMALVYNILPTLSYSAEKLEEKVNSKESIKQIIDKDVVEIVRNVRMLANKYCLTRDQAKGNKKFVSEEKHGTSYWVSYSVKMLDSETGEEAELNFPEQQQRYLNTRTTLKDSKGNLKTVFYYPDCSVASYEESYGRKLHGVYVEFFTDGALESFGEFKHGKYCGREMHWNKSGKLIESKINDCTEEFGIIIESDTGKHKIIIDDDGTQRIIPMK